ncbi:MAG: hypothetical protein K8S27_09600 [Candidatus Omnitrophica bacterium]|nr:hypothetical protein [Candidatus Omnitrophota bacterium]
MGRVKIICTLLASYLKKEIDVSIIIGLTSGAKQVDDNKLRFPIKSIACARKGSCQDVCA